MDGTNPATVTFRYWWSTTSLGNTDLGGVRTGDAVVEFYGSPGARLSAETAQAADVRRTGNTWVCFADCGPALVAIQVKAEAQPGVPGTPEFHNSDRAKIGGLAAEAQATLDSIYGGCPAPDYVNTN